MMMMMMMMTLKILSLFFLHSQRKKALTPEEARVGGATSLHVAEAHESGAEHCSSAAIAAAARHSTRITAERRCRAIFCDINPVLSSV
jgi:hypothetical protein